MSNILVFGEHAEGKVKKTTLELVSKAKELAGQTGGQVIVAFLGGSLNGLADQVAAYGAKKVALCEGASFEKYNTIAYTKALAEVAKQSGASIVLGTASSAGKDIFPRLAARLEAGMASESTSLRVDAGKLVARKPIYSGKAFTDVVFSTAIQVATARPNSFPVAVPEAGANAEVMSINADVGEMRCVLKEVVQGAQGKVDLTEAEIIVSGGRAMGNAENFKVIQALADVIGATVGASRAAVDSGYAPHDMQVGQTGKVVNPKLYIACGISGAIQHLAGMRTSKYIVAINKDPEAPIFSKADYGIVGDLFTIVPLLTEECKKVLAE